MILASAQQASRRYGDILALDQVSVDVRQGELVGMLGPNGAGKTTLLSMFVGIRRPTSGRVELFGGDPTDAVNRRQIGVTPQESGLPSTLRVGEIIDFVGAHFAKPVDKGELLERFGLTALARRQTGGLSGGEKRRLAVALAFVGNPRLVFLDEPTTGLDVQSRRALWDAIRDFHTGGGTVLLTSHYLEEIEALAQRVVVLGNGRVLADDTMAAVRGLVGVHRVSLTSTALPQLPGVLKSDTIDGRVHLLTADADQLVRDLVASGADFHGLQVAPTSLEEAFLAITEPPAVPDPAPAPRSATV